MDLAPTILDILAIDKPPNMEGESLLPYMVSSDHTRPDRASLANAELPFRSLVYGRWKLIRATS